METKEIIPTNGYILTNWDATGFLSTAIIYLEAECLDMIQNKNGKFYKLSQLLLR